MEIQLMNTLMMLKEQPALPVTAKVSEIQEMTSSMQAWAERPERGSAMFSQRQDRMPELVGKDSKQGKGRGANKELKHHGRLHRQLLAQGAAAVGCPSVSRPDMSPCASLQANLGPSVCSHFFFLGIRVERLISVAQNQLKILTEHKTRVAQRSQAHLSNPSLLPSLHQLILLCLVGSAD